MKIKWKRLIIIILGTFLIGNLFVFTIINNTTFYKNLAKPINIPSIVFPIVWTILYLLMSISFYMVYENKSERKENTFIYFLQLAINSLWTLFFFGFKFYLFSFIWLLLLIFVVLYMIFKFYNVNKISAFLLIPYLLWIIIAGYLNLGIYLLNK